MARVSQELTPFCGSAPFSGVQKLDLPGSWEADEDDYPDTVLLVQTLGALFPDVKEVRWKSADGFCPLLDFVRIFPMLKFAAVLDVDVEEVPDAVPATLVTCAQLHRPFTLVLSLHGQRPPPPSRARKGCNYHAISVAGTNEQKYPGTFSCIRKSKAQWEMLKCVLPGSEFVNLHPCLHVS